MNRLEFLHELHRGAKGYVDLRALNQTESARIASVSVGDDAGVEDFAAKNRDRNLYFGVATRLGPSGRDTANLSTMPGLWADLDFKEISEDDAWNRLATCALKPSGVVESGGGLHAYFLFREPLAVADVGASKAKPCFTPLGIISDRIYRVQSQRASSACPTA